MICLYVHFFSLALNHHSNAFPLFFLFFFTPSSMCYFLLHLIRKNGIERAEHIKEEIPCTLFILILQSMVCQFAIYSNIHWPLWMWKCIHIVTVGHIKHAEQVWRGWYAAALLLPLGMLDSVALPRLKTEEGFTCKCASACERKQTHTRGPNKLPLFMRMFFVFKENSKSRHTRASWCF